MAEIVFLYEGNPINIQCNKNQKMEEICSKLSNKINTNLNSLLFLYGGNQLNLDKVFNQITKENKINILVYKNENEICSKCGRLLNNKIIEEIIILNNNINFTLIGLRGQIDNIINDLLNKKDIIYISSQLKNINKLINGVNEDIKKNNNQLNQLKINYIPSNNINNNNNQNHNKIENDIKISKNEIICIYNKQGEEINFLHDYSEESNKWNKESQKSYKEGKNNINEKNIEIYINNKRIKFDYKDKSDEKREIEVKFIFNKLLTSTSYMFRNCSSLQSIDLSSFNTSNVEDMACMFDGCSFLKSIELYSFNTSKVKDIGGMFSNCSSLQSIDLSSFNTSNVKDMKCLFSNCSSLK